MDAMKISNLINRKVAHLLLDAFFPGQPKLAYFNISTSLPKSAGEVLDCAVKADQAGFEIDEVQLSEMTGFKLKKKQSPQAPQQEEQETEIPETPKEDPEEEAEKQEDKEEVQNSAPKPEEPSQETKDKANLIKAFDLVINPVRNLIGKLFKAKTPDEEAAIVAEIDELTKRIESQEDNEYIDAIRNISQ